MSRIYVALDLETTGLMAERDAILEIGAVKFRIPTSGENPIIDQWSTLVDPGRPIPYRISRLTGIQPEDVRGAPRLKSVLEELRAFIGNYPVIGHNVAFELAFLQRHDLLVGQASLDTFELASILLPEAARYSLGELARYLKIEFTDWHRALADAEMAMHLFLALWNEALCLPRPVLDTIAQLAQGSRWSLRGFFAAAARTEPNGATPRPILRRPTPPAPDGALASRAEPLPADLPALTALIAADGPLAAARPGFEPRLQQRAMLEAVFHAFERPGHLLVEAGTGSGKSLAYLLAAIDHAHRKQARVVIATHTLNLQDQIYYDELSRLATEHPVPFTAAQLKGRANYVCPRRVRQLAERSHHSEAELKLLARVLVWMRRTENGDMEELNLQRDERGAWREICSEALSCNPERCDRDGTCFWGRARTRAEGAHLLVVNHALLLANVEMRGELLPSSDAVIVDEAHHLEQQATAQFGYSIDEERLYALLDQLARGGKTGWIGLLPTIRTLLRAPAMGDLAALAEECSRLIEGVERGRERTDDLFDCLGEVVTSVRGEPARQRILPEWREQAEGRGLTGVLEQFRRAIEGVAAGCAGLGQALQRRAEERSRLEAPADQCLRLAQQFTTAATEIQRILLEPESNDVCWLRMRRIPGKGQKTRPRITLHRSPLAVGDILRKGLFDPTGSVVMTSATLSTEGSFAYLQERLGVEEAEELSLGTPFDVSTQAVVYLANDLPEPNQPHYGGQLQQALVDLARATDGRLLALFTSKSQLRAAYRGISGPLAADEIMVLGQHMDGSRTQLLNRFRQMDRAVLLGTQSFWEGIDVPGPALSCLAITRLPFPVPTDPVHEARAERYANPFQEYFLPQAVLQFRQGFGRLIRGMDDRGVIALLDSRLYHRSYGETFLNSLPSLDLRIGPVRDLPPLAGRWLARAGLESATQRP